MTKDGLKPLLGNNRIQFDTNRLFCSLGSMEIDSGGILRALNKKKKAQSVSTEDVDLVIYAVSAGVGSDYSKVATRAAVRGIGESHQPSTPRDDW